MRTTTRIRSLTLAGLVVAAPLLAACDQAPKDARGATAGSQDRTETETTLSEAEWGEIIENSEVSDPAGPFASFALVDDLKADTAQGCDGIRDAVESNVGVYDCVLAEGDGGVFVTAHLTYDDGTSQVVDYTESDGRTWSAVWASEPFTFGPPAAEAVPQYSDVVLRAYDLDGFAIIATGFEQAVAGGTVREFSVRGWFDGEPLTASYTYDPERDAVLYVDGDAVVVTAPILDSGSSASAPTRATVREDRWLGPNKFDNSVTNVALDDLPEPPADAIGGGDVVND